MYLSQGQDKSVYNLLPGVSAFQKYIQRLLPQFFHATSTLRKTTCKSRLFTLWSSLLFLNSYSTFSGPPLIRCNLQWWSLCSGFCLTLEVWLSIQVDPHTGAEITKAMGMDYKRSAWGLMAGFCRPLAGKIAQVRALRPALWCQRNRQQDQCSQKEWIFLSMWQ